MSGILQQGYSLGYVFAAIANLAVGGSTDSWKTTFGKVLHDFVIHAFANGVYSMLPKNLDAIVPSQSKASSSNNGIVGSCWYFDRRRIAAHRIPRIEAVPGQEGGRAQECQRWGVLERSEDDACQRVAYVHLLHLSNDGKPS